MCPKLQDLGTSALQSFFSLYKCTKDADSTFTHEPIIAKGWRVVARHFCTTITCSSSSHRISERFFMPRQDEAYPVNSWSHPLTPFPGHDSFLDIQPKESPRMSLQVKSVGIRLLQPPLIKLSKIFPTKKASRECWV